MKGIKLMHLEQLLHQLRSMRLATMASNLEQRLKNGDHRDLTHEEFLSLLVEDEYTARNNRRRHALRTFTMTAAGDLTGKTSWVSGQGHG